MEILVINERKIEISAIKKYELRISHMRECVCDRKKNIK